MLAICKIAQQQTLIYRIPRFGAQYTDDVGVLLQG